MWADDQVTLWLQYSTQWDSLAHAGAEFDADGDGVEEAVFYNGYRSRRRPRRAEGRRARATAAAHVSFAHHLGLEHMAFHGVQGRGVLVDVAHHLGHEFRGVDRNTLEEIMAADDVVVEPGDMLLIHTGFATKVLEWNREPDPVEIHRMCAYLDAHDESLLEWIADSQISALVADNYAVEGMVGGPRREGRHSLLPIHHLCLFKLGVPLGELWYLHELAQWLREHDRITVPAHRAPVAASRHRRLAGHPDRDRLKQDGYCCTQPRGIGEPMSAYVRMPGRASTTGAIALSAGTAVMMWPIAMKSSIVSAWKSGGGRKSRLAVTVGSPSTLMVQPSFGR